MDIIDLLAGPPEVHADRTPPSEWGKDHWSTYAYIAYCVTNRGGQPELSRMRCDPEVHPGLTWARLWPGSDRPCSPTRLKRAADGSPRYAWSHDDWSCVEDFESAGLLVWGGSGIHPILRFTEAGWKLWHLFEKHIADNPRRWSATFHPDLSLFSS